MSSDLNPEALTRAYTSYQANAKQWSFLGYNEATAIAVLTEFFGMGKVRNPSQKPLNVLSMVGKSRVKAIADAVKQQRQSVQRDSEGDNAPEA